MVSELGQKYPLVVKLLKFTISTPVSEVICESWGSAITTVMNKRLVAKESSHEVAGSTNMLTYIMIKKSLWI